MGPLRQSERMAEGQHPGNGSSEPLHLCGGQALTPRFCKAGAGCHHSRGDRPWVLVPEAGPSAKEPERGWAGSGLSGWLLSWHCPPYPPLAPQRRPLWSPLAVQWAVRLPLPAALG